MCKGKLGSAAVIGIAVVIIVGFGISELVIWQGVKFHAAPASTACPVVNMSVLPNNQLIFEKSIWSQWHWKYNVNTPGVTGSFQLRCPTAENDAQLTLNGVVAGRSDGKIASIVSKTNILDCHGNRIFISETGSPWQTFINSYRIVVSYLIFDSAGNQTAYVDGTHFLEDNIQVLDAVTQSTVATLVRDTWTLTAWRWRITAVQPGHPAANAVLLSLIAAQRSFHDANNDTDVCNSYFKTVGWVLVAVIIVTVCVVVYVMFRACKMGWRKACIGGKSSERYHQQQEEAPIAGEYTKMDIHA